MGRVFGSRKDFTGRDVSAIIIGTVPSLVSGSYNGSSSTPFSFDAPSDPTHASLRAPHYTRAVLPDVVGVGVRQ